ncbi:MAG: hypothetical protein QHC77_12120 [Stenotrophomonas sp.]|uniref:hypothetical protein n=1 Tax=Stenotrophomonas sp. TaxID=69392 RepID=UPI0029A34343|nr:hypothetical protein [Stenotrophomonas sp.]MDX3932670.1 hypothetical protein [Stenotrophomonas sp.]
MERKISWLRIAQDIFLVGLGSATAVTAMIFAGPIRLGNDAPAWVQAIGSIAAILIAILVPAIQHWLSSSRRRDEQLDRARSLGLHLLPHIQVVVERNNEVWANEHPDHDVIDLDDHGGCAAGPLARAALGIPSEIAEMTSSLHELGPAAEGIQKALFSMAAARELVIFVPDDEHLIITNKTLFYDLLWDALMGAARSQNTIESFFRHNSRPVGSRKK